MMDGGMEAWVTVGICTVYIVYNIACWLIQPTKRGLTIKHP
jgi:hypothetical protein